MGLAGVAASEVSAQTAPAAGSRFVNVNIGAQPPVRSIDKSDSFPLYDETATVTTSQGISNGAIVDINGGYRVWRQLGIGIGYSTLMGETRDSSVVARIPDPLVYGRLKTVNTVATGLNHTEQGIYLQALWFVPITDKIEIALSAGPSFIRVKQELVSGVTVAPGTQNVSVVVSTESRTAMGANLGFDGNYFFSKRFGAGLFVRYSGGSIDLPGIEGLSVGGFQTGLGFRARF
jgi:hypothetical protein